MQLEYSIRTKLIKKLLILVLWIFILQQGLQLMCNYSIFSSLYCELLASFEINENYYLEEILKYEGYKETNYLSIPKEKLKQFKYFIELNLNNSKFLDQYILNTSYLNEVLLTNEKQSDQNDDDLNKKIRLILPNITYDKKDIKDKDTKNADINDNKLIVYLLDYLSSIINIKNQGQNSENFIDNILFEFNNNLYIYPGYEINNKNFNESKYKKDKTDLSKFIRQKFVDDNKIDKEIVPEDFYRDNPLPFFNRDASKHNIFIEFPYLAPGWHDEHLKIKDNVIYFDKPNNKSNVSDSEKDLSDKNIKDIYIPLDNSQIMLLNFNNTKAEDSNNFLSISINNQIFEDSAFYKDNKAMSIIRTFINNELIYNVPCLYFQYVQLILQNNFNTTTSLKTGQIFKHILNIFKTDKEKDQQYPINYTLNYNTTDISSCFINNEDNDTTKAFEKFFSSEHMSPKNLSRHVNIEGYEIEGKFGKIINQEKNGHIKVFYTRLPFLTSKTMFDSEGERKSNYKDIYKKANDYNLRLYLLKDLTDTIKDKGELYTKLICFNMLLIFFSFFIYIIAFAYIAIAVTKLINKIYAPIKRLLWIFSKFNMSDENFNIQKVAGELHYDFDIDINNLFTLCKNMLLGKFLKEDDDADRALLEAKKEFYSNLGRTYNKISFIKSNNLVCVDDLEDDSIYKRNNPIDHNMEEILDVCEDQELKLKHKFQGKLKNKEEFLFDEVIGMSL